MIIDCIGCLHGFRPPLEGGDLLILTGDYLSRDSKEEWVSFLLWVYSISKKYRKVVIVAGNHDNSLVGVKCGSFSFSDSDVKPEEQLPFADYLLDSGIEFEGLKIWGSPWTSRFKGINPKCCAFTGAHDEDIASKFELIPSDVDILITHGPPFTIRDLTKRGEQVGSPSLMANHIARLRPKLWAFSHVHEGYGNDGPYLWSGTRYVNCSIMNERYQPVNAPIRIVLGEENLPTGG